MTITPMATGSGRQARVQVVPDLADGDPATNPAGTIQVQGTFANVITAAGGAGCAAGPSLNLPLTVTNFSREPLHNVQVQITEMARAGFEACKPAVGAPGAGDPALLPVPANTSPGAALGLASYGSLAGAPSNTGTVGAGGAATVQWWFNYPSNTPTTFKFIVWADPRQPELDPIDPLLIGAPLTWTSTGSAANRVEVCATDPAATAFICPEPVFGAVTSASLVPPYAFTWIPPGLLDGGTYWWRAINTFGPAGTDAGNYHSGWDVFTAVAPFNPVPPTITGPVPVGVATPPTFDANVIDPLIALPINVTWLTGVDVVQTHIQICDTIDCLPGAPGVGLIDEAWVDGSPAGALGAVTGYDYILDVSTLLPTDPLLLDAQIQVGVYYVNVYNWDGIAGLDVGQPAVSAFEIIPPALTPVGAPSIVGPVGPELDAAAIAECVGLVANDPCPGAPSARTCQAVGGAVLACMPSSILREQFPADAVVQVPQLPIQLQWTSDPSVSVTYYRLCDTPDCLPNGAQLGEIDQAFVFGSQPAANAPFEYAMDVVGLLPIDAATYLVPGVYYFGVMNVDGTNTPFGAEVFSSFEVVSSNPAVASNLLPASGTLVSQQAFVFTSFRQVTPVVISWATPANVVDTMLEVSYTPDFAAPYTDFITSTGTAGGLNTYSYDLTALPLLVDDLGVTPAGTSGAYLWPGLVYWRVVNIDPTTGNLLRPASLSSTLDIVRFKPVWSAIVPDYTISQTMNISTAADVLGAYVQLCDVANCATQYAGAEGAATPTLTPGVFTIDLAALVQFGGIGPGSTAYIRIIDEELTMGAVGANQPASYWTVLQTAINIP